MEAGVPIGLPSRTVYAAYGGGDGAAGAAVDAAHRSSHASQCRWSDLLTFNHVRYWHLPRNAEMHLTLRAVCAPRRFVTLGHCSFSLFSKKGRLKSGRKKVAVELYSKAATDGAGAASERASTQAHDAPAQEDTPSTRPGDAGASDTPAAVSGRANMDKLDKLMQRYDSNAMSRSAWLDVLAFRRIDQLNQALGSSCTRPVMMVEMERWDRCVMYGVKCYSLVPPAATWHVADAELCCDSPVELKHRKLTRSLHRAVVDRNLQPDSAERRLIHVLLKAPWDWADLTGVKMNADDKQLLWRYRFALTKEAKALSKCLISVDWSDEHEVEQAVELVEEWERSSTIDMNEALQLLSADFTHPKVRMAAARRVAKADDKELVGYLLQLVQALRYEAVGKDGDSLLNLLVDRAAVNLEIANYLHWYLFCQQLVEADVKDLKGRPRCYERAQRRLMKTRQTEMPKDYISKSNDKELYKWMAQFCESHQRLEAALNYYQEAEDYLAMVRVRCYQAQQHATPGGKQAATDAVEDLVETSGNAAAAFFLASQFEAMEKPRETIRLFSKAGRYKHAVRMARDQGLLKELLPLALQASKRTQLETALFLQAQGQGDASLLDAAVTLFHKCGNSSRALEVLSRLLLSVIELGFRPRVWQARAGRVIGL